MPIVHPPATDRETDSLEALDWQPPCEYTRHELHGEGPAKWAIWFKAPTLACGCPGGQFRYFCAGCWNWRMAHPFASCNVCGRLNFAMTNIVRVEAI